MPTKAIAVIGATGAQGGGLVRAMLDDPARRLAPLAVTRKPQSPAARALVEAGAKLVRADLDDEDSLAAAFEGAQGVFAVTNFWEHHSPEKELEQARNLARAALRAGVRHVIWSTLADTRDVMALDDPRMPVLKGRYKVPHMDAKGEANAVFREAGVPTTYLYTSYEMAAALARALGEPVRYQSIGFPEYAQLGFSGAEDLANMFQYKHDFNDMYLASRPVEATRRLHPGLMDFDAWLVRHGAALAQPMNTVTA